jgi:hypothetical protein
LLCSRENASPGDCAAPAAGAITLAAVCHDGNKSRWERVCSLTGLPATGVRMSIMRYLDDFDVDPETNQVLHVALEKTRMSLGLVDDLADGIIAKQIVELAKAGERNLDLLCEGTLNKLREHLFGD